MDAGCRLVIMTTRVWWRTKDFAEAALKFEMIQGISRYKFGAGNADS